VAQNRDQWQAIVNSVMTSSPLKDVGNLLAKWLLRRQDEIHSVFLDSNLSINIIYEHYSLSCLLFKTRRFRH
jgi:hypothetical protein